MQNRFSTDELKVKRGLSILFFVGVAVALPFLALKTHNPLFYVLFFALPLGAWFVSNPAAMLIALYFASYARIVLPGLPGGLELLDFFQMLVVGWGILHLSISQKRQKKSDMPGMFIILFFLNMLLIIAVRGFGMGSLGGSQYGGKAYILLTIAFLFYFAAPQVHLKERHIRLLFWGAFICSWIPAIVQASMYITGGATWVVAQFFDLSSRAMVSAVELGGQTETVRWSEAYHIAQVVLMIALIVPGIRRRRVISLGLVALAGFLILITGFRGQLIWLGVMCFWWMIYNSEKRMATLGIFILLGVVGWLAVLATVSYLSFPMQRALSFLPLVADRMSDPDALMQAQKSFDFRLEVWDLAWKNIPQYLLIGRGLLMDITGWAWLQASWYGRPEFFYDFHAYHSGLYSLLIDFGLFGLVAGTGFMLAVCSRAWQSVRKYCGRRKDLLSAFYVFLTIRFSYSVIAFFLVYGSVKLNFSTIILNAVLLKIFARELVQRQKREEEHLVPASVESERVKA